MGVGGNPGPVRQYVSGLCAATLGLCAAGWLALAPAAFGYRSAHHSALHQAALQAALHRAALADWATASALAAVALATLLAWIAAWRRQLRADGVLAETSRRQAWREARARRRNARDGVQGAEAAGPVVSPPDPERVLSELRALLVPLLAEPEAGQPDPAREEPAADRDASRVPASRVPFSREEEAW